MSDTDSDRQQRTFSDVWPRAQLSSEELWSRYFALGGDAGVVEIDAYVHGRGSLPALHRDLVALAVNERLDELAGLRRAAYSRPVRESRPRSQPLNALIDMLDGARCALDDVPHRLRPEFPPPGSALRRTDRPAVPGRGHHTGRPAFRRLRTLPSESAAAPCLWVPIVDGVERLGVLEVAVEHADDLYDPGLRAQCRWLSMLLGHLIGALNLYGDALTAPRTTGAELIWALLPPATAGVDDFVVSGMLGPRDRVCGDAFDYTLSESTARLLVLDAVGHDLASSLIAAAAVSAYRGARRAGLGLLRPGSDN